MAATGAMLSVLIIAFGPVSGAHFNPAVTFVFLLRKDIGLGIAAAYIGAQLVGAILGVVSAHFMFELELLQSSQKLRLGPSQWYSEFIATFGLVFVILGCVKFRESAVPLAVGLYISAAYWFTSSTSFAQSLGYHCKRSTDTLFGNFTQPYSCIHRSAILRELLLRLFYLIGSRNRGKVSQKYEPTLRHKATCRPIMSK